MSGWLNGIVKAVHSGDCITIMGKTASGPPPEKVWRIGLVIQSSKILHSKNAEDVLDASWKFDGKKLHE